MNPLRENHVSEKAVRMSREVLVYDLLLVALNIGFCVLIYHYGARLWAMSGGVGVEMADVLTVVTLTIFWSVGNLGLVVGLMGANRRANEGNS